MKSHIFCSRAANLDVGEDVHVDVVRAGDQIDGGEEDVAGEELLRVYEIGMGWNVIRANWRYDFS